MKTGSKTKLPGIYIIKNKATEQVYVGSSVSPEKRIISHLKLLEKGSHPSRKLQESWNQYTPDHFEHKVIEYVSTSGQDVGIISSREQFWIDYYDSINNGYNAREAGHCADNRRHTDNIRSEIRAKVAEDIHFDFLRICACYGLDTTAGIIHALILLWKEHREAVESHERQKAEELGVTVAEIKRKSYGHSKARNRRKRLNLMGGEND